MFVEVKNSTKYAKIKFYENFALYGQLDIVCIYYLKPRYIIYLSSSQYNFDTAWSWRSVMNVN